MSRAPRQLTFDLALRPAFGAEDFLVGPSNQSALAAIDQWPDWPHHALILEGPAQSGKSHLGQVWRLKSGAAEIAAADLTDADVGRLTAAGALLVENLEAGISDERILFHILNAAREHKGAVLLTTRRPVAELVIALPDLASRLRAVPRVAILAPDEALLRAVLVKHFADRQLAVEPTVVGYLALRMERSMAMAEAIVTAIDNHALAAHRKVTRVLAAEVLNELSAATNHIRQDLPR